MYLHICEHSGGELLGDFVGGLPHKPMVRQRFSTISLLPSGTVYEDFKLNR